LNKKIVVVKPLTIKSIIDKLALWWYLSAGRRLAIDWP